MGMAYIDCPELSSVFGCDVVVHATQAHLESIPCSKHGWQMLENFKKNVRKMVVELGKKNFIVWLINKHGDLR
jgi:hypothetical protein